MEVIVVVDCIVMITATMEVKMKGILLPVEKEEILAATKKQMPSINGMETDAATKGSKWIGIEVKILTFGEWECKHQDHTDCNHQKYCKSNNEG